MITITAATATKECLETSPSRGVWQDPVGQITKMDQFLGLDRGPALCQQIAETCRFSSLKKAKDAQFPENRKHVYKEGATGVYRKGDLTTAMW